MALITDGPSTSQRAKIEALALNAAFSPLVVTAELGAGRSKPHTAAFELVQEALGHDKRFVYVADNPLKDFLAPNLLGWESLRIKRPSGLYSQAIEPTPAHAPQHVVSSLDDVRQLTK
jgi:putative hydrolase of the HAD superfamily